MDTSLLWKLFYTKWNDKKDNQKPGYTVLIMVPGDLPVFLKIALDVCSSQKTGGLSEVLVIPDNIPNAFLEYFTVLAGSWKKCPIRLIKFNPFEFLATKYLNNPATNNWLQFVHGCNEADSKYLLWHDADLFIKSPDFLEKHYEKCSRSQLYCLGVSEVWDKWYKENGYPYLAATWELMLDINWVKRFMPWKHKGHKGTIDGKFHEFDSTLLPQCLTDPAKISYDSQPDNFVHFNYVISTYRHFQNSKGHFEDDNFRLLLVRLLIDAYDTSGWKYEVPSISDLIKGLKDPNMPVTYVQAKTRNSYGEFRDKLQQLMDIDILDQNKNNILLNGIRHFDAHFEQLK